jgi:hypothetical protein
MFVPSALPQDFSRADAMLAHDSEMRRRQQPLLGEIDADDRGKKCLVLDLDETLVHSSFRAMPNADYIIPVRIDDVTHQVCVDQRRFGSGFGRASVGLRSAQSGRVGRAAGPHRSASIGRLRSAVRRSVGYVARAAWATTRESRPRCDTRRARSPPSRATAIP